MSNIEALRRSLRDLEVEIDLEIAALQARVAALQLPAKCDGPAVAAPAPTRASGAHTEAKTPCDRLPERDLLLQEWQQKVCEWSETGDFVFTASEAEAEFFQDCLDTKLKIEANPRS
ncbi:hypothetical protein PRIPAC_90689 [Pristionchus pacificus]|uniref:Uncharacterized protein n=1 Tax=Pristionchus pacificus TaxID=54126 RepID=A0A2A6B5S0_PRIPA|nr:hypothetical protein PRIPAC_90689 [Pristionchus pacificus]|eukprot:PDM61229.1 hypothetical protein PRIPAC_50671 [Pristionchus pacificus]